MTAKLRPSLALLTLSLTLTAHPARAQQVPVTEQTLSNGMKILLVQRTDEPNVAGGWLAHVGSANEHDGITGIAHLFEHMMFKGTTTIGTSDPKTDLDILAQQEKVRDQMRLEEALMRKQIRAGAIDDLLKPENWTPRYRELQKQFQDLVQQERKVLVKNEFDKIYTANGASGMNAFTMQDMTAFFCTIPANKLELWMWMESERIYHPVFREFYAERDVVFEERRMRLESTPPRTLHGNLQLPLLGSPPLRLGHPRLALRRLLHLQTPGRQLLLHLLHPPKFNPHPRRRL